MGHKCHIQFTTTAVVKKPQLFNSRNFLLHIEMLIDIKRHLLNLFPKVPFVCKSR